MLDCSVLFTKGNSIKLQRGNMIAANITGPILVLLMSFSAGMSQIQSQPTSDTKPIVQTCKFSKVSCSWQGLCGPLFPQYPLFMQNPTLTIALTKAITTGVWRKGDRPMTIWAGEIKTNTGEKLAIEIEVYDRGSGVMRSDARWFPVSGFALANETLQFQLDTCPY